MRRRHRPRAPHLHRISIDARERPDLHTAAGGLDADLQVAEDFLSDNYAGKPQQVAEAVRALRPGLPDRADGLLRLLRNRPALLELYLAVRAELNYSGSN